MLRPWRRINLEYKSAFPTDTKAAEVPIDVRKAVLADIDHGKALEDIRRERHIPHYLSYRIFAADRLAARRPRSNGQDLQRMIMTEIEKGSTRFQAAVNLKVRINTLRHYISGDKLGFGQWAAEKPPTTVLNYEQREELLKLARAHPTLSVTEILEMAGPDRKKRTQT